MFYKLEYIKSEDMLNLVDIVEDRKDDDFIYATQAEFDRLKPNMIINYMSYLNMDRMDTSDLKRKSSDF